MIDDKNLNRFSPCSEESSNATAMRHNLQSHIGQVTRGRVYGYLRLATAQKWLQIRTILRHNNLRRDYELPN
ncbi:uncharacterized protein EAE97_004389 [Botrytis byssoidea]|uniref:Uncharacterized protein n=1 Tax=Botrytis byssoidea TaxID=139641 RepID=A0A9P5IV45_9HELO|nr:uncharacterized protein EAE97_004389 [Botrytis byssoidea]KAF7947140.1 hypothetical protein EAE97_004389 [Botrytis byssoidea]